MKDNINERYLYLIERLEDKYRTGSGFIYDNERYHNDYDMLIYDLLRDIGYVDIATRYLNAMDDFWYS